ncbi:MAG: hypothetical protein VXZ99_11300 [Pseudomonadota bacterium]|nr:hypothetical protein [Pseudomonadota bacterium]
MSDTSFIEAAGTIKKLASSEFSVLVEVEDEKFELHFDYLGWPLIARITPHESGSLHMQLLGKVGRLSFAAEGRERRIGAIMLLRSTAKCQPIRFALTRNGDTALTGDVGAAAPVIPTKLIAAIPTLLAGIKPLLDLFPLFIGSYRHPPN